MIFQKWYLYVTFYIYNKIYWHQNFEFCSHGFVFGCLQKISSLFWHFQWFLQCFVVNFHNLMFFQLFFLSFQFHLTWNMLLQEFCNNYFFFYFLRIFQEHQSLLCCFIVFAVNFEMNWIFNILFSASSILKFLVRIYNFIIVQGILQEHLLFRNNSV